MAKEDSNSYLSHHGIVGMHWGQRNGPPYPLGYNDHSASEKKAGWQKSLSGNSREARRVYSGQKSSPKVKKASAQKTEKKQSDKSEAAMVAVKVAVGVLTLNPVMVTNALVRSGQAAVSSRNEKKNEERMSTLKVDKKSGLRLKGQDFTPEEDLKKVNPGVHNFDANTKNNCMCCTTAYELRRRGYDVSATKSTTGYTPNDLKNWFPKAKVERLVSMPENRVEIAKATAKSSFGMNSSFTKATVEGLKKQGDGARGNLMVIFGETLGGHSMFYEVKDGNVIIRDAQIGKTYKKPEAVLNYCIDSRCVRLDNLDFDAKKIKEAVK